MPKPNDVKIHETKVLYWAAILDKDEVLIGLDVQPERPENIEALVRLTWLEENIGYFYEGHVSIMDADVDGTKQFIVMPISDKCLVDDTCSDARSDVLQNEILDKVKDKALLLTAESFARTRGAVH